VADVFISYSKADVALVRRLSAFLESKGWSVWWDRHLSAGDEFRDEIMKQLGRSRAVIVVWTNNSTNSQWVRSEAGRAQADAKLITVRTPDVGYKQIPAPFDVYHAEEIANEEQIHAAVVAKLSANPPPPPIWKKARYELFSWLGIIGAAVTLTTHAQSLLNLSLLSRYVIQYWTQTLTSCWNTLLSPLIPKVTQVDALILSIISFTGLTLFFSPKIENREPVRTPVNAIVWTTGSFAFLLLIFAAGTLSSPDISGIFYAFTRALLLLLNLDIMRFSARQQRVLLLASVMICLAVALLIYVAADALRFRREMATHRANVVATSTRLHRIVIAVILIGLLNELSSHIETWVRSTGLIQ
jgi:hypothetical protein